MSAILFLIFASCELLNDTEHDVLFGFWKDLLFEL